MGTESLQFSFDKPQPLILVISGLSGSGKDAVIQRLDEINAAVNGKPLVLHGGSGIPFEQTSKAITLGVSKINVNTELQLVFAAATREYIEAGKDVAGKGYDPRKLLKPGCDAIIAKATELIKAFGSENKA